MPKPVSEQIIGKHVISGRTVHIQCLTWADGGTSYDVVDADGSYIDGGSESFDVYPSEQQITVVLRAAATAYCVFCQLGIIGNGHLIGAAEPGSNPHCCDDCWDPRLA